jgi:hypothetical protein
MQSFPCAQLTFFVLVIDRCTFTVHAHSIGLQAAAHRKQRIRAKAQTPRVRFVVDMLWICRNLRLVVQQINNRSIERSLGLSLNIAYTANAIFVKTYGGSVWAERLDKRAYIGLRHVRRLKNKQSRSLDQ